MKEKDNLNLSLNMIRSQKYALIEADKEITQLKHELIQRDEELKGKFYASKHIIQYKKSKSSKKVYMKYIFEKYGIYVFIYISITF